MYLWQPIAAGFYAPCVDGDFDMSVIAHEYGHAISNRMAGGPNANLSGNQPQAMGESWSDLMAIEYLHESGFTPVGGENPFAVGPYVTGDKVAGIRNYGMNNSPLNYSDVGYDFVCNDTPCTQQTQVHADGEIWSATNYDIRQAFIGRYGATGGRRWIQLVFDGWLLMATGAGEHARRPQRDAGRRPAAQQRRQPRHHVERVRQARLRARRRAATRTRTSIRCPRSTRRTPTRRRSGSGRPATRPARRPSCSWAATRRARTRSPTPTTARR